MSVPRFIPALLALCLWLSDPGASWGQVIFSENFDDPAAAASRFSVSGSGSYAGGVITLQPQSSAISNPGLFNDSGLSPILYSVMQSFGPGSLVFPQYAGAEFRVRGSTGLAIDGYFITTALTSLDPYIAIDRITTAERALGITRTTLLGGSIFAPPPLRTLGPYELGVTFHNSPNSVLIEVTVNGIPAVAVEDTSPYRLTHGDLVGFDPYATHTGSWDDLTVTLVPEPSTGALWWIGLAAGLAAWAKRRGQAVPNRFGL
jgi:hypothetical protein